MNITVNRILSQINEKGCGQAGLAAHLGIRKQAITEWKNGTTNSYEKYLSQMATFFDVSTDYLLGNTDIKKPEQYNKELLQLLNDPINKQIFEKLKKLNPDLREIALAQLEALATHQESKDNG